ncbi:two-partner secretion domain-containing protein [Solimonas sp. K1W22B-7]|uniref:two-partner secretion domain-containing protein n=1 Tax=Solimonas sp. K1W22B-7 TaxID=2303331 RepID=UPI0013C3FE22|nr:filamentous hemagglutinin N-terminal domain-containing protein [Solimonas sp. K1W22B-7]
MAAFAPGFAWANPMGGVVVGGAATIANPSANTVRIDQTSSSAIINWQDFSIGSGEFVQFVQPSASAAVLNRVVGGLPSEILGNLSANGRVFIVNPQGVMFGAGSRVDTGSLVATTFDIADQDFLDGNMVFAGDPAAAGSVVNRGEIVSADGGFVVLASGHVSNENLVQARLGKVALLSGSAMTLSLDAEGLIGFAIDADAIGDSTGAFNSGDLMAEGGRVVMSAHVARLMAGQALNNSGRIRATSIDDSAGEITLIAQGGDIGQVGDIGTAGAAGQAGGEIVVEADQLTVGGGPAAGCSAALCEGQLENLLQQGSNVGLVARDSVTVETLADGAIDGRSSATPGSGGFLLLGIGSTHDGNTYDRGSSGSVSFAGAGDSLLLDGSVQAYTGRDSGTLTVGSILSREFIILEAADDLQAGNLAHAAGGSDGASLSLVSQYGSLGTGAIDARNNVYLQAGGDVTVSGNIKLAGAVDVGNPQFGAVAGSRLEIASGGDILLDGGLEQTGSVNRFDGADNFAVRGSYAEFDAADGDVTITGPIEMNGTIGAVTGNVDWSALGSELIVRAHGGTVTVEDSITVDGSIALVNGTARIAARGSEISLGSALDDGRPATVQVTLGGPVTMTGNVDLFGIDNSSEVIGSFFQVGAIGGETQVNGAVSISGQVGELGATGSVGARGGYAEFVADGGKLTIASSFDVSGSVASAGADNGLSVNGASLFVDQRAGDVQFGGNVRVIGQITEVGASSGAEVRAADFAVRARGGSIEADGTLYAEGHAGTVGVGDSSFSNGVFLSLQADGDVLLHGNVGAVGSLADLGAGSGVGGRAAELSISGQNIIADGNLLLNGQTGSIGAGDSVFASGASLGLSALGDVHIGGNLGVIGGLVSTGSAGSLVARAADLIVHAANIEIVGIVGLEGKTGSVAAAGSTFAAGSYLELVATGDARLGGIDAVGSIDLVSGGDSSGAQAVSLLAQAGGALTVTGDVYANGHNGSAFLGNSSASNGVQLALKGAGVELQGGLEVIGLLDATEGGDSLRAQATRVEIASTADILVAHDLSVNGRTGAVIAGESSQVSGALLDLKADGAIGLGGGLSVIGALQSVHGSTLLPNPADLSARAANMTLAAGGDALTIDGDILLEGTTGTIEVGSDSDSNGVFAELFAVNGDVVLHGSVTANGVLDSTTAGDFLFAEAAEMRIVGQTITVDGDVSLTGETGFVLGGAESTAIGSALGLTSLGGDITLGGSLGAEGSLGTLSSVTVGGESHAQAVALIADATAGLVIVNGDVVATGHTGVSELGFLSFSNGAVVKLGGNGVVLHGDLSATGSLGASTSGFGVGADAADVVVNGQFISIDGSVSLDGATGVVTTGDVSKVSGSYLEMNSNFGILIGGGLSVDGSLAAVGSTDPDAPSAALEARATSVSLTTHQSGAIGIGGDVTLHGTTGTVQAGDSSSSNGVFLSMTAIDFDSGGAGNVVVNGNLTADGRLDSTTAGNGLFARATEISITTISGSIQLDGDVSLSGRNGAVSTFSNSFINAISVEFDVVQGGDILLGKTFTASGRLDSVTAFSNVSALATELDVQILGGQLDVAGDVALTGTTGTVSGANDVTVNGVQAGLDARQGDLHIGGNFSATGTLGSVSAESDLSARAAELEVFTVNSDFRVDGDLVINGSTGNVTGFNGVFVNGAYANLMTIAGSVAIGGTVRVDGTLGSVSAEQLGFASGAELLALPDGEFRVDGDLLVSGTLGAFTALNDSGAFGADVFVFSGSQDLAGDTLVGGRVEVSGQLESVNAGERLFTYGAFASFKSLQGDVNLQGPVTVAGQLGSVVSGDDLTVSGSGFWADADAGNVRLAGPLSITGTVQSVDAANGAFLNGSYAYLTATEGNLYVDGDLTLGGTLASVQGDSAIAASGADLLLERSGSAMDGELRVDGDIRETGSVGSFTVGDADSSSRFSGGLLLNANDGRIAFRDVSADNAFIYFNQDSTIGESHLLAREYLEIVTPSGAPTLSADLLSVEAPNVFISANIDAGSLQVMASDSLAVSAANLHGEQVHLSGGLLQLADDSQTSGGVTVVSGDRVRLEGARILSDAGTLIDAGGLDVVASETIRLAGLVRVGSGLAQDGGDAVLLQQIGQGLPGSLPVSAQPNAYFSAPTVALAQVELAGDYLHIQANTMRLGSLALNDGTLVHLDPLVNLPFFTESVDVTDAGLDSVKDRLATEDNRVIPNLGTFNNDDGSRNLGDRPVLNDGRTDQTGDPQFQVGGGIANLGQLVLQSGLADNTVVIGGSDYEAGIQISDQLVVDVLPSRTNFVFATSSRVLIAEPIRTNGQVLVLGGGVETDRSTFYSTVVDQINAYYEALAPETDDDDGEVEEKSRDGEACE